MGDRLRGKVALVTGAAQGQGEAESRLSAREGARVVMADVREQQGRALAADLGDAATFVPLDVRDPSAWDAAVATTLARFGRIDVLVNNAGTSFPPAPIEDVPLTEHHRVVDVNLHGVYLGMRAVKGPMRAEGSGSIVNISSIDGIVGALGMTSYAATKFAVTGMTKTAAIEMGPLGIRVNSIHPGIIDTPMVRAAPAEVHARLERVLARQPIPRMGRPEEVAYLALFLASDESSYCTGAEFVIDGGHIAGPYRDPL
jgi:3alpha(or 20beta)-hydroxysteroid dehydrogenase